MNKDTYIFIGAHPDDIEYGAGGVVSKLKTKGQKIIFVIMAVGDLERKKEQIRSAKELGASSVIFSNYKDGYIHCDALSVKKIRDILDEFNPKYVFTHWHGDTHQDHRATSEIVRSACGRDYNLLYFDSFSSIGFEPTVFVNISGYDEDKRRSLRRHKSQIKKYAKRNIDFAEESICKNEILASKCGIGNKLGFPLAEGFIPAIIKL